MNDPYDYDIDAKKTYNYVRLAIVGLLVALAASVVLERVFNATCIEGSISAYYYTPAHSIFVGALVAIGVLLIAIKGTRTEDLFLNLAGFMAPIVALVPTSLPPVEHRCSDTPVLFDQVRPMVNNNALAMLLAGALVYFAVWRISRRRHDGNTPLLEDRRNQVGLLVSAAVLALGTYLYFGQKDWFADHAHLASAGLMFVFIGVVVLINARATTHQFYRRAYWVLFAAMVASLGVVGLWMLLRPKSWHAVLIIEILEIVPFLVFWLLQSVELWNVGSRRVEVADELPKMLA